MIFLFLVRYLDEDIHHVIPGKRVVVSLSEGLKLPGPLTKPGEDPVYKTTEAISQHLQLY